MKVHFKTFFTIMIFLLTDIASLEMKTMLIHDIFFRPPPIARHVTRFMSLSKSQSNFLFHSISCKGTHKYKIYEKKRLLIYQILEYFNNKFGQKRI